MSSTGTLGHKLPRKSSTKGRHISQRDPLPKGASCQTCRTRKVRCDAGKPACRACLRTARFEGRDEASVVCCYDKRPAPSKKGGKRGAASKAQQTVAAVSQGAVDAGPSHQAGSSSQSTPYSSTFPNPYLTSFPLTSRADSYESLAADYYTAAPAAPQHTPTPPLSYSSANSPEDSVLAQSPPDQHPLISRPPSTSAYSTYAATGGIMSSSGHGFHLPPIVPGPHGAYSPYQSLGTSQHTAKPSSPYSFAPPPMRETSTAWPSQHAAQSSHAPQLSYANYDDGGGGPARAVYNDAYMQLQSYYAHSSALPRIEPYGRTAAASAYPTKRPDLAVTLPPPRLSSTLAASYSSPMPPIVSAQAQAQTQASRYSQPQRSHPGAGGGAYESSSHAQPSHTPQDPTFSLPMQQQAGPGFAAARSPFPLYAGTSSGGGGGASGGGTMWPTLPSPSAPVGWAYPATSLGGGRTASTSGYGGPVDEWLRGLAT